MYLECMLVFKSYKPLKLEKGMFFLNNYLIRELIDIPRNQDDWIKENGYPVEMFIIDPGNPNEDNGYVIATPEQIGWFDEGDHSDQISDISIKNINDILEHYEGWIDVEMAETEEDDYVPVLYDNKVTIRMPQEPYDDDSWDNDSEPNDDQIYNNHNHEGGIKH